MPRLFPTAPNSAALGTGVVAYTRPAAPQLLPDLSFDFLRDPLNQIGDIRTDTVVTWLSEDDTPGPPGAMGPAGPPGAAGRRGLRWHFGHGPAPAWLPDSLPGDLYLELDSYYVWELTDGGFVLRR